MSDASIFGVAQEVNVAIQANDEVVAADMNAVHELEIIRRDTGVLAEQIQELVVTLRAVRDQTEETRGYILESSAQGQAVVPLFLGALAGASEEVVNGVGRDLSLAENTEHRAVERVDVLRLHMGAALAYLKSAYDILGPRGPHSGQAVVTNNQAVVQLEEAARMRRSANDTASEYVDFILGQS